MDMVSRGLYWTSPAHSKTSWIFQMIMGENTQNAIRSLQVLYGDNRSDTDWLAFSIAGTREESPIVVQASSTSCSNFRWPQFCWNLMKCQCWTPSATSLGYWEHEDCQWHCGAKRPPRESLRQRKFLPNSWRQNLFLCLPPSYLHSSSKIPRQ